MRVNRARTVSAPYFVTLHCSSQERCLSSIFYRCKLHFSRSALVSISRPHRSYDKLSAVTLYCFHTICLSYIRRHALASVAELVSGRSLNAVCSLIGAAGADELAASIDRRRGGRCKTSTDGEPSGLRPPSQQNDRPAGDYRPSGRRFDRGRPLAAAVRVVL